MNIFGRNGRWITAEIRNEKYRYLSDSVMNLAPSFQIEMIYTDGLLDILNS